MKENPIFFLPGLSFKEEVKSGELWVYPILNQIDPLVTNRHFLLQIFLFLY